MSEVEDFAEWARGMSARAKAASQNGPDELPWHYTKFTDAQIAALGDDEFDRLVQAEAAKLLGQSYRPKENHWEREFPPDYYPEACRECHTWKRYPEWQRHFGWNVWLTCKLFEGGCKHECHKCHIGQVWLAP